MQTLMLVYLAGGTLLVLLAIPLLFRKIKPNGLYGVRVAKTLNDPAVWYAANAYAARWLLATGVAVIVSAAIFYKLPGLGVDAYAYACLAVFAVVFGWGLLRIARFVRSL